MNRILELSQYIQAIIVIAGFLITITGFCTKKGQAWLQSKIMSPVIEAIKIVDINQCKSYLTDFLAEMESGKTKTENQIKRAYEVYEHYTNKLHQNSYVHDKWEDLKRKELI